MVLMPYTFRNGSGVPSLSLEAGCGVGQGGMGGNGEMAEWWNAEWLSVNQADRADEADRADNSQVLCPTSTHPHIQTSSHPSISPHDVLPPRQVDRNAERHNQKTERGILPLHRIDQQHHEQENDRGHVKRRQHRISEEV